MQKLSIANISLFSSSSQSTSIGNAERIYPFDVTNLFYI